MPSELFFHHFPEIGPAETRSMTLPEAEEGVPAGNYAFVESYCTERGCDCRRVLLHVTEQTRGIVAVVSYGFDRRAPACGPYVDPLHPTPRYAAGLLQLMNELLFSDAAYVARLVRHYEMIKAKTDPKPRAQPSPAARAEDRKKKRKRDKSRRPPA